MPDVKYQYTTKKESRQIAAFTLGGIGVLAAGLSLINPALLGISLLVGSGQVAFSALKTRKPEKAKRKPPNQKEKLAPPDAPVRQIVEEMSVRMGRPTPPDVYIRSSRGASCTAYKSENKIVVTDLFLKESAEQEKRFVLAHEMSHLEQRGILSSIAGKTVVYMAAAVAFLASGFGFISLPALAASLATVAVARAVIARGARKEELHADRGALYITRDLEAGKYLFSPSHNPYTGPNKILRASYVVYSALCDHPSRKMRIAALEREFNEISRYPVLPEVVVQQASAPTVSPAKPAS